MPLTRSQHKQIQDIIRTSLRRKLEKYRPESQHMPFHTRLLGKDRLALYSFIHSLNTNFGVTIFEPVALELATSKGSRAASHIVVGNMISEAAQAEIQRIIDGLTTAQAEPNKLSEIERIRNVCKKGKMIQAKPAQADLVVERRAEGMYLFDLKTVKPNVGDFQKFKKTLLEWIAVALAANPRVSVHSMIAIPYNPYAPEPYNRWTMRGMLDLKHELMVAEEFWDFLGGAGTYEALLNIFEKVGIEMRSEIDRAFKTFK